MDGYNVIERFDAQRTRVAVPTPSNFFPSLAQFEFEPVG